MKEPYPQFNLRLSDELRTLIKQAANRNRRSQTAEVEARLLDSFARDGALKDQGGVGLRSTTSDARDLAVVMELMVRQLDLMHRELNDRLRGLQSTEDE